MIDASSALRRRTRAPRTGNGLPAVPRLTGAQIVYEALRRAIIALDLAPGSALEEEQLCRQFNVSRTPVREALIRLSSEGLAEVYPNRGAKVASLEFIDVVDHYEAMDIFQPVICHFAAVRRTDGDLRVIEGRLEEFRKAIARRNSGDIIRTNYELHAAIVAACHNRRLEQAYRQMLVDKLRIAQQGFRRVSSREAPAPADRFAGTLRLSERLVRTIGKGDGLAAERMARELNVYVRQQMMDMLSANLAAGIALPPPGKRTEADSAVEPQARKRQGRRVRERE
jgi:DNA-binding GntR family transcriptional regulator